MMGTLALLTAAFCNAWKSLLLLPLWTTLHVYLLNALAWSVHGVYVIAKTAHSGTNLFALALMAAGIVFLVKRQPIDKWSIEMYGGRLTRVRRRWGNQG